jgi:hypothetical protein
MCADHSDALNVLRDLKTPSLNPIEQLLHRTQEPCEVLLGPSHHNGVFHNVPLN